MGIPASEVDRLFDRFFRASNARETRVPGSGLGLPTAKAITELHGGRIEVASVVGTGHHLLGLPAHRAMSRARVGAGHRG